MIMELRHFSSFNLSQASL